MKPYIYSIIFLLSINFSFSQTKETVFKKSYKTDANTILNLNLKYAGVIIEESPNDSIYFNYDMVFGRYSKGARRNIKNQPKIKESQKENLINFEMKNSNFLGSQHFFTFDDVSEKLNWFIKDITKKPTISSLKYKTIENIVDEIKNSQINILNNYRKKQYTESLNTKSVKLKKTVIQYFIIKVPKHIKIRLKAFDSNININYNMTSSFVLNSFKSILKFKELSGLNNRIIASKGVIEAQEIAHARLELIDLERTKIGTIKNTDFITETSRIEIGEVGENVKFTDFNSKMHLFNFTESFSDFNFKGDYSELNFYNVKEQNYSMDVFGFNTTLNLNKVKTTFTVSEGKKTTKILEKKPKNNSLNKIDIKLKNGILNIK